jgi:hypothetical protein
MGRINKKGSQASLFEYSGAGEESRTLDLNLGKVALYQLSYSRIGALLFTTLLPQQTQTGAGEESRTLDLNLGKVALYQLSYSRVSEPTLSQKFSKFPRQPYDNNLTNWSGRRVSNSRPQPWQGCALPTELLPLCYLLLRCVVHNSPAL